MLLFAPAINPAAAEARAATVDSPLVQLALAKFHTLSRAERAMLEFSQAENVERGEFAIAGTSDRPQDPGNDPTHADEWSHDREIRADLLAWSLTDPGAVALISPRGIAVVGARIAGSLDLSRMRVPFALVLRRCALTQRIRLIGTEIPFLDLSGSHIQEMEARGLIVHGDLILADGFHSSGEIVLDNGKIGGNLDLSRSSFHHSAIEMETDIPLVHCAIAGIDLVIGGDLTLHGSSANGAIIVNSASIGGIIDLSHAHISDPGGRGFWAQSMRVGDVFVGALHPELGGFDCDTSFDLEGAQIRGILLISHAHLWCAAPPKDRLVVCGFHAEAASANVLIWRDVQIAKDAIADFGGMKVGFLLDDPESWPAPGMLAIDGFVYGGFGAGSPTDVASRLHWIGLNSTGFQPNVYTQLAATYRAVGMDKQATQVLIARDDARYASYGLFGKLCGTFLKTTIAYGHQPLRAILWSLIVVIIGSFVVSIAKRARVMRLIWTESTLPPTGDPLIGLSPLMYSLDVFLPFVNLHQEHYWLADETAVGSCEIGPRTIRVSGSAVRTYLWCQTIAGWLLSAIFVAGVTGLLRND